MADWLKSQRGIVVLSADEVKKANFSENGMDDFEKLVKDYTNEALNSCKKYAREDEQEGRRTPEINPNHVRKTSMEVAYTGVARKKRVHWSLLFTFNYAKTVLGFFLGFSYTCNWGSGFWRPAAWVALTVVTLVEIFLTYQASKGA